MATRDHADHDHVAHADIDNRFTYHPPVTIERQDAHDRVRAYLGEMAHVFTDSLPPGREKSLVVTHLEEAMFWANAAIARQP
jgi:hypothetical protein